MASSPHATGDIYCVTHRHIALKNWTKWWTSKRSHQSPTTRTTYLGCIWKSLCRQSSILLEGREQREVQQTISGFTVHTDHIYQVIAHYFLCSLEPQGQCICFQREMGSWDIGSIPRLLFLTHFLSKLFFATKTEVTLSESPD